MRISVSLTLMAAAATCLAGALYACSSDNTSVTGPTTNNPDSSTNDVTTGGGDGGGGTDTGSSDAGADVVHHFDASGCAFQDDGGGRAPDFQTQACYQCIGSKCCAEFTACHSGNSAEAGADGGSANNKTNCMLYGECVNACDDVDGGVVCEAQCQVNWGVPAENQWNNWTDCANDTSAAGCGTVCSL